MSKTAIQTLGDIQIDASDVVMCRVDFNVPLDGEEVRDATRIQAALPTIQHLLDTGAKVVLCSHFGRPKGQRVPSLSLLPVAAKLAELLEREVIFSHDIYGPEVVQLIQEMPENGVMVLENLRFVHGEKTGDAKFAQELAALADIFVNDAFGAMHRSHASITGVPQHLPSAAGLLVERETKALDTLINSPERPFAAILGGAKVSDKLNVIEALSKRADHLFIGGAMAYTFMAAKADPVGKSRVEKDKLELARAILAHCEASNVSVHLPVDHVVATELSEEAETSNLNTIPEDRLGLDIGPETVFEWTKLLDTCQTVFWNGPMGVFEIDAFSGGTKGIAEALAASNAFTIIGGGDSAAAANQFGLHERIDHISTGGGASLEYLEAGLLPGLDALRGHN